MKNENFQYYGGSLKNPIFRGGGGGGFTKNQYIGGVAEKEGMVFLTGGWYPMHTIR